MKTFLRIVATILILPFLLIVLGAITALIIYAIKTYPLDLAIIVLSGVMFLGGAKIMASLS